MNLKPIAAAVVLISGLSVASAGSLDVTQYSVSYDETTTFGSIASWGGGGSSVSFQWTVPDSASVASTATFTPSFTPALTVINDVALPSFTVTAKSGWALSNLSAFLGNLSYVEVGGATTGILAYADVSVNGGPVTTISGAGVPWTQQSSGPNFATGYFAGNYNLPSSFSSFTVSNAHLALSASGGVFSSISANNQNKLEVSFTAVPVPEPETYAMFLGGLAALGWFSQRRRNRG